MADFDRDPEALAWARRYVQRHIDKTRRFSEQATVRGDADQASQWRRLANYMQREFIGGEGCVIAAFDERRPQLPDAVSSNNDNFVEKLCHDRA